MWRAFGPDVNNYVEPFAGSLAVLLGRPGGAGKIETVNDVDRYLANFWRAVKYKPDLVAKHADWPVNEADLHAWHKWLVNRAAFRERMHRDPKYYDVEIAGKWVWGICQWIGGGWCVEPNNHKHPKLDGIGKGVHSNHAKIFAGDTRRGIHARARGSRSHQRPIMKGDSTGMGVHSRVRGANRAGEKNRPDLSGAGKGVHSRGRRQSEANWKKRPDLDGTSSGRGVHSEAAAYSAGRRPALSSAGQGVHLPALGNDRGLNGVAAAPCVEWFRELQARLRNVRVACGDWKRVLGPSVLGKGKNVGGRRPCAVFLDPPYPFEVRDPYLYSEDDRQVWFRARDWAIAHGDDRDLRIALCGYAGDFEMPKGWVEYSWKAARGYASEGNDNRELERIWFSPHCLPFERQISLFEGL